MPVFIAVGQTGTLRFLPSQAGLDPALIASVSWQPQGAQTAIKFTAPDKVEGATVTMTTPGEKVTYAFTATCNPAGPPAPPKMDPVAVDLTAPTP